MRHTHHRAAPEADRASGFTLIELVVVMVIMTVMLGMLLPRMSTSLFRSDLDISINRISYCLAYARSRAMISGKPWELTLDFGSGTIWPHAAPAAPDQDDRPASPSDQQADDAPQAQAQAENGTIDLSGGLPPNAKRLARTVRFIDVERMTTGEKVGGRVDFEVQPRGLIEPLAIHLADDRDKVVTVRVSPFNARTTVQAGYVDSGDQQR